MAPPPLHFWLTLLCLASLTTAGTSFRPKALVLRVSKDPTTLQYYTTFYQTIVKLATLDLGGQFLWINCDDYGSLTYRPARCRSAQCSLAKSSSCTTECYSAPRPGCHNNTCGLLPDNTITGTATSGDLGSDLLSLQSTDGKNPGEMVTVPNFLFVCGTTSLLQGLGGHVSGMAGLGRTQISLPSQFSSAFSFRKKFAICLTGTGGEGVVFFGDGPYSFLPDITFTSKSLSYTPLIRNPVSTASAYFQGDPSSEYFIGVTSIKINGNVVPVNKTLLSINKEGYGGTKISTVNPYTVLETSIYKAVVKAFVHELAKVPRVRAVAPFGVCFRSKDIGSTRVGAAVPQIDLVLQGGSTTWSIFGANSMVYVNNNDVVCLGFVDGGVNPRTSIVIGGHQIEDNLLQFDLAASRLGFSSTLLGRRTTCANFNFTSTA